VFGKTQRGVSERPKWLGTLVAILAVLCIAVVLMLWKPWQPVSSKNQITSDHYKEEETNKDYRFYDLLPQQQVTPIPEQAIPESKNQGTAMIVEAPSTAQPAASESVANTDDNTDSTAAAPQQPNYILQVRSYADPDQADARRAEIILNGLSADVIKSSENGKTWYRVISGPYDTQEAALAAQQTLQHSGIDSIVIKRK